MTEEKICLASADGHVGLPTALYKDYLEERLHRAFDEFHSRHVSRWSCVLNTSYYDPNMNVKFRGTEGFDPSNGTAITWDSNLRIKAMDQSMIVCEVLLPDDTNNNDPPWGSGLANAAVEAPDGAYTYPPELIRAGARAYNRWLAEFCSTDPVRLQGLTILGTLDDLVWCIDEIYRAYDSGLRTGIMLPLEYGMPLFHHPSYDMLWKVCSELNLPVVSHIGRGYPSYLGEDPRVQLSVYSTEGWVVKRPIWSLILGGVLERFPNLRLVITEAGIDWVAPMLQYYDEAFEWWPEMAALKQTTNRVKFSMKPSEYWQRQCFVTHSIGQLREEFEGAAYDNVPNMIFGADLGHMEGMWPVRGLPDPTPEGVPGCFKLPIIPIEESYKSLWEGLPASKMLPHVQDNFFRAYSNVNREVLEDVVERVGPTTAQLGLT